VRSQLPKMDNGSSQEAKERSKCGTLATELAMAIKIIIAAVHHPEAAAVILAQIRQRMVEKMPTAMVVGQGHPARNRGFQ